jgi:hypothetical protein
VGDIVIYRTDVRERQDCPKFYRVDKLQPPSGSEEYGYARIIEIDFDEIDVDGESNWVRLSQLRYDQHAVKPLRNHASPWDPFMWRLGYYLWGHEYR